MDKHNQARIRWQCRRGMLELDTLLQNFFDKHYLQLSPQEKQTFTELLEYPDQELFSWLMGNSSPEQTDLLAIVRKIQQS